MIERHSSSHKVTAAHLARKAVVYVRQSSPKQVRENLESQRLQYALADRARALGFGRVEIVDGDLGRSASLGAAAREGFDGLVASVALGEVGMVLGRELSRLARTDKDFCHLLGSDVPEARAAIGALVAMPRSRSERDARAGGACWGDVPRGESAFLDVLIRPGTDRRAWPGPVRRSQLRLLDLVEQQSEATVGGRCRRGPMRTLRVAP